LHFYFSTISCFSFFATNLCIFVATISHCNWRSME
jgi:hypothetical protein